MLKFIYSEKAAKFYEISTVVLSFVVPVKYIVQILQNFVAFSEYMNFKVNKFSEGWKAKETWMTFLGILLPSQNAWPSYP